MRQVPSPPPGPPLPPYQQPQVNGVAVASFVLGIVGLVFFFFPPLGLICGVLGTVFGFVGTRKAGRGAPHKGLAIAGLILGILALVIAILIFVAIGVALFQTNSSSNNGVTSGLGSQDATADVTVTTCKSEPDGFGGTQPKVVLTVTNHSSKRSDYFIEVQLVGSDGSRVGDGNDVITGLEPGQSTIESVADATTSTKTFTCRLQTVQRTASQ